jgi:hypothetical protein
MFAAGRKSIHEQNEKTSPGRRLARKIFCFNFWYFEVAGTVTIRYLVQGGAPRTITLTKPLQPSQRWTENVIMRIDFFIRIAKKPPKADNEF